MYASSGLDKGAAEQFESGNIRVRSGVEATAFTRAGLRLSDGSEVKGNVIIFAYVMSLFRDQPFSYKILVTTEQVMSTSAKSISSCLVPT